MLVASPADGLGPNKNKCANIIFHYHPNQDKVMTLTFERKLLRVMRLTSIILLTCCMHVAAKTSSQTVTYQGTNIPLEKVLTVVKKQTGYVFIYDPALIDDAKPVTISAKEMPLENFLDNVLINQQLDYEFNDRTVIIKKKNVNQRLADTKSDPPVTGIVRGPDGRPIANASVQIKGTKKGTTTDKDGRFSIEANEGAEIEISSIGFGKKVVSVNSSDDFVVILDVASSVLDEVQYIAYGQTSKRLSTGNISSVKAADIEKQPVSNPLLALQGRVPGMVITQESGIMGGPVTIRVQGQNSIGKGNDPLIIIDGVPYPSSMATTGVENTIGDNSLPSRPSPLNFINPSDIESIDILKDADATAIYGSRAANGAILITTKKGQAGPTKVIIDVQQGSGEVTRHLKMLNTRQYLDMRYEGLKNDEIPLSSITDYDLTLWDTTRYTDWQKVLTGGTAQYTNANSAISGGNATVQFLLAGTYQRQTTVFPGGFEDQRGALHFTFNNTSINQKFRLQFSGNYMMDDNRLPGIDLTQTGIVLEPIAPKLYNSDGALNWEPDASGNSTWENPLINILYRKYKNITSNLVSNLQLTYNLVPGLDVKSSFGYTKTLTNDYEFTALLASKPEERNISPSPRFAKYGFRNVNSWIIEPQVNYHRQIGRGNFNGLIGASIQQNNSDVTRINGSGYSSDEVLQNTGAALTTRSVSSYTLYRYNALFGRLNYNFQNKYVLNLSARRDGSSRFGDKNKFHNFGSAGLAWIFSEEKFAHHGMPFLSFGKLRASYGTTGNDQVGDYAYLNLYSNVSGDVPYQNGTGLRPNGLSNPYLEWEETRKLQYGMDLGFFKDRVILNITFARNKSSNQLLSYALPTITGFNSVSDNFPATVQNTSWEAVLNTINVKSKNFSWTSAFNLTIPKNKLVAFPDLKESSYKYFLIVGQPVGVQAVYHLIGVDENTGQYVVADSHGEATVTPNYDEDRTVLVDNLPRFYGGLQNTIEFKGFQLDFLLQFTKQTGTSVFFNNGAFTNPGEFFSGYSNQPITVLNRWQKPGDVAGIQRYSYNLFSQYDPLSNAIGSDANFSDASYVRLKNLSFSYRFPEKWIRNIHLQTCSLYMRGQNLLTITNYVGLDPENRNMVVLPPLRILTLGLKVGL
jgi:TonB-dependent starch-binding outer membrane protein SusC